jgi:hypothetical protein
VLPLHPLPLTDLVWDLLLTAMKRSVKLTLKICAVPGTQPVHSPERTPAGRFGQPVPEEGWPPGDTVVIRLKMIHLFKNVEMLKGHLSYEIKTIFRNYSSKLFDCPSK